jgi:hypothetical protein
LTEAPDIVVDTSPWRSLAAVGLWLAGFVAFVLLSARSLPS